MYAEMFYSHGTFHYLAFKILIDVCYYHQHLDRWPLRSTWDQVGFTTTVVLSSSFGSGYSDDIDDMIDFIIMFPHLSFWFLLDFFTPGNGTSAENAYPSPYLTLWNNPHLYLHPCSKRGRDKVVNQQGMSSPISISISP